MGSADFGAIHRLAATHEKHALAISIALQTHVFKACPVHRQVYLDEDADAAAAFALAGELIRKHRAYAHEYRNDAHELTDLLTDTLSAAPVSCVSCGSPVRLTPRRHPTLYSAGL